MNAPTRPVLHAVDRAEQIFQAQARVRAAYRDGDIDRAISEYDASIAPALGAVDPRIRGLANRVARSLIVMVDADLAAHTPLRAGGG